MFGFFRHRRQADGKRCNSSLRVERLEERLVLSVSATTTQITVDAGEYEEGSILVRFADDQPFALEQTSEGIQIADADATGATTLQQIADGWYRVELTVGMTMEDALAAYGADPNVLYAQPNYVLHITQVPNDPNYADMWDLENTGQTGGTVDADIDASFAWDVTTGSGSTIVAVIDTGIDYNHPDLAANIWVNTDEVAGDGIDNDGNNYIDDVLGYDFINLDADPMDDQGHGTHVAGTIGAVGDNGIGVTGINWNVQLMALKFLGADGSGTTEDAIEAIYYAIDNGADVINASWGGDPFSQALYDAIAAAGAADVIFVAAAGNGNALGIGIDNDANPFYPSGYDLDNIVAVAAIDHNDNLATFSNYGATTVDIAAPGVNILSTTVGGGYGLNSGTSMAAPHVAGVIALVRDLNPTWTADQVIQQVLGSVDPLPGLQGIVSTGGRLNAATAVGNPAPPPPPPPPATLPMFEQFSDGEFSFVPQTGNWSLTSGRYTTTPVAEDPDFVAVSTLNLSDPLPSNVEIRAIMEADPGFVSLFGIVFSNHLTNGYIIYDYVDADNFKFAGADIDGGRWIIGHRAAGSWIIDAQVADALQADVQYEIRLLIENDTDVKLIANGVERLTFQHAAPVTDGAIGVGAKDSTSHFDDILVQQYVEPVPTALPADEDFDDGLAQNLAPELGVWFVNDGQYETVPGPGQDAVSTFQLSGSLPSDVQLLATINADDVSSGRLSNGLVIFDYHGPTDFKFAGAFVGADRWVIGHRTATGWVELATLNETIDPLTDYALDVRIVGDTVTLVVDGVTKISHTFTASLIDGDVGVGTQNAIARFDNLQVREFVPPPPPPPTALPTTEDFNDGVADFFDVQLGNWTVESGRYRVVPLPGEDGVSTLRISDPLPSQLQILATINADGTSAGRLSNGLVIFDYHSPTDFKFAGAFVGANRWTIGHRTASGWVEYATLNETINALTDYDLDVVLDGDTVTLTVDGVTKISHTFTGDALTDGDVGVGTQNALARFDDITVQQFVPPPPPPSTTLPTSEDFNDGVADFFDVQLGSWSVESGRYSVVPLPGEDGVSTLRFTDPLPSQLEILATINADGTSAGRLSNGLVIFDYHSPTDFKFAGAFVGANRWTIGHRTAAGWVEYATLNETINALTDYDLDVVLDGDTVTLSVDGVTKASHTFTGDALTDGDVGVGTQNALARFDDITVQQFVPPPPPPSTTLPTSEDFNDGVADFFDVRLGDWTVESGRYSVVPLLGQDGVATLRFTDPLPSQLEILATINADGGSAGRLSNGLVIFDYQGPTDFKFAGAFVGANRWTIGHRTAAGWVEYATLNETINALTDYDLDVVLDGDTVTLSVDGVTKISHTFTGDALTDGDVGVGTQNALARFDDVTVQQYVPPPSATLPMSEDFEDGVADFFDVRSGDWTVESGRYRVVPVLDQDGVSTVRLADPLPGSVEILATLNADDVTPNRFSNGFVIFDYQSPTNFKFAGAYVASNIWVIGRRDATGWFADVSLGESISPATDYDLQVILEGGQVSLLVDGVQKLTYVYSGSVTDGDVGVGTRDALAYFDNVQVSAYSSQSAAGFASTTAPETDDGAAPPRGLFRWSGERVFAGAGSPDDAPPAALGAALQPLLVSPSTPPAPNRGIWSALDDLFANYGDDDFDDEWLAELASRHRADRGLHQHLLG